MTFMYHLYKETIAKQIIMTGFKHQGLDDLGVCCMTSAVNKRRRHTFKELLNMDNFFTLLYGSVA